MEVWDLRSISLFKRCDSFIALSSIFIEASNVFFQPCFERVDTVSSLICGIQCSFSIRSHISPDIISVVICTAANERNSCSSAKSIFVFFALALSSIQLIVSAAFPVISPLAFLCSRFWTSGLIISRDFAACCLHTRRAGIHHWAMGREIGCKLRS